MCSVNVVNRISLILSYIVFLEGIGEWLWPPLASFL